jgi:hypothetical protein
MACVAGLDSVAAVVQGNGPGCPSRFNWSRGAIAGDTGEQRLDVLDHSNPADGAHSRSRLAAGTHPFRPHLNSLPLLATGHRHTEHSH